MAAEAHREWLQTAVTGKAALIDDLIALAHQHIRTTSVLTVQSQGLYEGIFLQPTDEQLYAMYIHELDCVYAQTNAVFDSSGMDLTETASFQRATLATNGEVVSMQCWWKQFFPFDFDQTCDTMWMLSHLINRQEARETHDEVKDQQNTIATKFRVTRQLPGGGSEALLHRFVHRRFVEKNRMVSVWRSSIMGDGGYRGMQMNETGWCVYWPLREGTFGQVCVRQIPLHIRSAQEVSQPTARRFDDFVQTMVRENCEQTSAMANTLLLDNALNGIRL